MDFVIESSQDHSPKEISEGGRREGEREGAGGGRSLSSSFGPIIGFGGKRVRKFEGAGRAHQVSEERAEPVAGWRYFGADVRMACGDP